MCHTAGPNATFTAAQQYCQARLALFVPQTAPTTKQFQLLLSEASLNSLLLAVQAAYLPQLTASVGPEFRVCVDPNNPATCFVFKYAIAYCVLYMLSAAHLLT